MMLSSVKVKLPLGTPWRPTEAADVELHLFLTLAVDERWVVRLTLRPFYLFGRKTVATRSYVGLGPGLSLWNKPIVTWKCHHSFSAVSEKPVLCLRATNIRGSIWERYIQSTMHVWSCGDVLYSWGCACRIKLVFQSFWYCRTIFIKLFVPEYPKLFTEYPEKTRDIKIYNQRINWVRKVQNRFLRRVGGKVGHYQTSVCHAVRHYKRDWKTFWIWTINGQGKTLVIFLKWPSENR